jgi:transposase InsO family protein
MSKHRVAVLKVVTAQLSVTAAAAQHGISRQHLHRLIRRYREGGLDDLEPRSRRPLTNPGRTPEATRDRIVALRRELTAGGLDGEPVTIAWHLKQERLSAPAVSTIRRILHAAGLVVPEPRKRPRSSWIRFEAAAPNELWQSDFTHWRLADGSEVEIIGWLDDHSRYLLGITACGEGRRRRRGGHVRGRMGDSRVAGLDPDGQRRGLHLPLHRRPQLLRVPVGVSRHPAEERDAGPPQTQGKVERFHQTLKHWLACQPAARSLPELQLQLERCRIAYNEARPHRAIGRITPAAAYAARPKAHPAGRGSPGHFRLRYDITDKKGAISLRRAGRMHHLRVGAAHAGRRVLAIVDVREVTVVALDTGELLPGHLIEPDRGYRRNRRRDPGRWPGSRATG